MYIYVDTYIYGLYKDPQLGSDVTAPSKGRRSECCWHLGVVCSRRQKLFRMTPTATPSINLRFMQAEFVQPSSARHLRNPSIGVHVNLSLSLSLSLYISLSVCACISMYQHTKRASKYHKLPRPGSDSRGSRQDTPGVENCWLPSSGCSDMPRPQAAQRLEEALRTQQKPKLLSHIL